MLTRYGSAAEFNVLCDPHAASILLDAEVPVVMAVSPARTLIKHD